MLNDPGLHDASSSRLSCVKCVHILSFLVCLCVCVFVSFDSTSSWPLVKGLCQPKHLHGEENIMKADIAS